MQSQSMATRQQYSEHILRQFVKQQYCSLSEQAKSPVIIRSQQRAEAVGASECASRGISWLAELITNAQTDASSPIHNDRGADSSGAVSASFF